MTLGGKQSGNSSNVGHDGCSNSAHVTHSGIDTESHKESDDLQCEVRLYETPFVVTEDMSNVTC